MRIYASLLHLRMRFCFWQWVFSPHRLLMVCALHSLSLSLSLNLKNPHVLEWKIGDPLPRRKAQVVSLLRDQTHVLVIDLGLGMVPSHVSNPASSYPPLATEDISVALQVVQSNEEFQKSIMAGGVESSDLYCSKPSAGWFGPNEEGRSVVKVQCFPDLILDSLTKILCLL